MPSGRLTCACPRCYVLIRASIFQGQMPLQRDAKNAVWVWVSCNGNCSASCFVRSPPLPELVRSCSSVCDGSISLVKRSNMEGRGGASTSAKAAAVQGVFSKMDTHLWKQADPGAALSLSHVFSCRLCCVTLGLGSLVCRSAAVHIPCFSFLSRECS